MSGLTLTIDTAAWHRHQTAVLAAWPGIVPVAKGNGYGFGLARLARRAEALGVRTLAVGLPAEVAEVRDHFSGDIVILQPWRPFDSRAVELAHDPRVISTVSHVADLEVLNGFDGVRPRVLLEVLTSMRRHGMDPTTLPEAARHLTDVRMEGWAIHLPLPSPAAAAEGRRLASAAVATHRAPVWLSHVDPDLCRTIADEHPADGTPLDCRLRIGTGLWLGAPAAYTTAATVLDVHAVRGGDRVGYHQHRVPGGGWIVVLAGGTSHGIAMEAPTSASTARARLVALASGALAATGHALSPYTLDGRKRAFVEPPHMQSSMVFLPGSATPPQVGDQVPVQVRMTTVRFDETVES